MKYGEKEKERVEMKVMRGKWEQGRIHDRDDYPLVGGGGFAKRRTM